MSSDDDPASDAVFVVPPKNGDTAPASQPQPIAKPRNAKPEDGPSSTSTTSSFPTASSGASRSKDFWHTNSITTEPSTMESSQTSNGSHGGPRPSRWTKARSTSTESSLSLSGMTSFGSTYNQDGFPNYPNSSEDEHMAMDDAAIAKQLALTDEAVRAINGTPSVVQAGTIGRPMTTANAYELPRSMAAFVRRPGDGERDLRTGRSFVSSGSSTSSEESEHLASVQWVSAAVSSSNPQYTYSPYPRPLQQQQLQQQQQSRSSPSMPPPPSTHNRPTSPRRNGSGALPSSGGNTPNQSISAPRPPTSGNSHQPPTGASAEGSPDNNNDDDDQTVGGMREGSPSSSSASGLDLLSHAAAHHERTRYSTSTRRKAGAEAVAQWRESGIPSGSPRIGEMTAPPSYDSPGYDSTPSAEGRPSEDTAERPTKRRKSNVLEKPVDLHPPEETAGAERPADGGSESEASGSDAGHGGKGGRKTGAPKGKRPRVRATLLVPPPAQPPAKQTTPKKTGKAAAPAKPMVRRESDTSEAGKLAGGVQCDYINPLPPYQRCPDVFTRKYDIPRHMARHARREGDLVTEGKLPEEKALLWKTIRDKPRIRCKTCGEYFTRQDALKRHQSKQHH